MEGGEEVGQEMGGDGGVRGTGREAGMGNGGGEGGDWWAPPVGVGGGGNKQVGPGSILKLKPAGFVGTSDVVPPENRKGNAGVGRRSSSVWDRWDVASPADS